MHAGETPPDGIRALGLVLALAVCGCSSASGEASGPDGGPTSGTVDAHYDGPFDVPTGPSIEAALTGCGGPGYAAKFKVGTQTFDLTVDTGSGTLAVASSTCSGCGVTPEYTPGPSATDDMEQVPDMYAQGSWQGEIYTDSVELVGATSSTSMRIAAIDSQSGFFISGGCGFGTVPFAPQGIAGFGPSAIAVPGTDAFVTKFLQANGLPEVFALELCAQGGQLMFGGVDPAAGALTGAALYTSMMDSQYYTVALGDMGLGGKSLGFGAADFGPVMVDTGTSVLALPSAVYAALDNAIQELPAFSAAFGSHDGGWLDTAKCFESNLSQADMDAQFPELMLSFPAMGGGTSALKLAATKSYLSTAISNGTTYYCSGIDVSPVAGTILGSSVMRGEMVIFDLDANRIGFAPQSFCQ
jgi:hypothetical protein